MQSATEEQDTVTRSFVIVSFLVSAGVTIAAIVLLRRYLTVPDVIIACIGLSVNWFFTGRTLGLHQCLCLITKFKEK